MKKILERNTDAIGKCSAKMFGVNAENSWLGVCLKVNNFQITASEPVFSTLEHYVKCQYVKPVAFLGKLISIA